MKLILKYSIVLAGALITMTGAAFAAECASDSDCPSGQGCMAPWSFDQDPEDFTCRPLSDRITSFGGRNSGGSMNQEKKSSPLTRLVNAMADLIRPIVPPTMPRIVRPAATTVAPRATRAADVMSPMAEIMRRIEKARRQAALQVPAPLQDENDDEYICVPENDERVGLDCAAPKKEVWKENERGRYTVCEDQEEERDNKTRGSVCAYPDSCNIGGYGKSFESRQCQIDISNVDTSKC